MRNNIEQKPTEEYLLNKTTIGGIDESKLYEQTLKKKVYVGLPENKFSKIMLLLVVIVGLSAISYFGYKYWTHYQEAKERNQNINVVEQPVKIDAQKPALNTRQQIMQIVTPFDIESDEFIKGLENIDVANNKVVLEFLNKNKYESINKELLEFQKILESAPKTVITNP